MAKTHNVLKKLFPNIDFSHKSRIKGKANRTKKGKANQTDKTNKTNKAKHSNKSKKSNKTNKSGISLKVSNYNKWKKISKLKDWNVYNKNGKLGLGIYNTYYDIDLPIGIIKHNGSAYFGVDFFQKSKLVNLKKNTLLIVHNFKSGNNRRGGFEAIIGNSSWKKVVNNEYKEKTLKQLKQNLEWD